MIVSRRIPVLAYLFLSCLIALYAFKFHLSTLVDGIIFNNGIFVMNFVFLKQHLNFQKTIQHHLTLH